MNPKEKAKYLFDKMKGFRVKHSHSKKCARIAVEEILKTNEDTSKYGDIFSRYWLEVLKEIDLL